MKSASVVNVDMSDVSSVDSAVSMHTKQLAAHWKVDPRSLTDWIASVRRMGYEIGQKGERNRTYFNDVDQDLIKAARYKTLTKNPNPKNSRNDSEKVLSMDDRRIQEEQEAQSEAQQNRNLELATTLQSGSSVLATRKNAAYQEGVAIATAELGEKVRGYLETRVQAEQAFELLVQELDGKDVDTLDAVEVPTPKQLVAALF